MKINTPHSNKKVITVLSVLLVLAVAAGAYYWYSSQSRTTIDRPENTVDYSKPSDVQRQAGQDAKKDFENREAESSRQQERSKDTNTPTTTASNVQLQITSANITNQQLSVRVIIQTIDADGSCSVTLAKGESQIMRKAGTQTMGSYSTCKGFDIDMGGLASGEWMVKVNYAGSEQRSGEATSKVTL